MATQQARNGGVQRSGQHAGTNAVPQQRRTKKAKDERLAQALGWFSIGLGLAELLAPRRVARLIGVSDDGGTRTILRVMGLREITSGVGILTRSRPAGWLWSRVGGDVIDLSLLGAAFSSEQARHGRVAAAASAVMGVSLLDLRCSRRLSRTNNGTTKGAVHVKKTLTVNRPPEEVYRFWRDFQNLPRFMSHLESVQVTGERRSHWKAKAPAGMTVEWDAELIEDRPSELIAWRSVEGADVDNAGSVRFAPAPGGRGTEIRVELRYDAPGGKVGAALAKLFGEEPGQQVQDDLRAFKQVMETGEVVHSEASIHRRPHPARPPEEQIKL